jgi:hypothetical protein
MTCMVKWAVISAAGPGPCLGRVVEQRRHHVIVRIHCECEGGVAEDPHYHPGRHAVRQEKARSRRALS